MMPIRKADRTDVDEIQSLAEKSWSFHYKNIISEEQIAYMLKTMYREENLTSEILNPNYHYFIFDDEEGKPIGFMGFENHFEENTTKLHRIYFLPKTTQNGNGTQALDFLKTFAQNAGDSRIILNVNKKNSARAFYEKNGFTMYAEGKFSIGNGFFMDDFLMEYNRKEML